MPRRMRRTRRRPLRMLLLNSDAAASLLLCLATAGLWVRSYFRTESLAYIDDIDDGTDRWTRAFETDLPGRPAWSHAMWHDEWEIISARGVLYVCHNRSDTEFRTGIWRP